MREELNSHIPSGEMLASTPKTVGTLNVWDRARESHHYSSSKEDLVVPFPANQCHDNWRQPGAAWHVQTHGNLGGNDDQCFWCSARDAVSAYYGLNCLPIQNPKVGNPILLNLDNNSSQKPSSLIRFLGWILRRNQTSCWHLNLGLPASKMMKQRTEYIYTKLKPSILW